MTNRNRATARRTTNRWPLYVVAAGAAVATWGGWVELGQMTGFGVVHPLPGIWDDLSLNSAITLPLAVEAYGAFGLKVWLGGKGSARTQRFARSSSILALLLGVFGQIAYHVLAAAGRTEAPVAVTVLVACLPVLMLGLSSALGHMVATDAEQAREGEPVMAEVVPVAEVADAPAAIAAAEVQVEPAEEYAEPVDAAPSTRRGHKTTAILEALTETDGDVKAAIGVLAERGVKTDASWCYHVRRTQWAQPTGA